MVKSSYAPTNTAQKFLSLHIFLGRTTFSMLPHKIQMLAKDANLRLFCDECGTLIKISTTGDIRCPLCKGLYDASLLNRFSRTVDLVSRDEQELGMTNENSIRTIINERCPECGHEGLYVTTAQLRSADEGQTVFYECPNCGHRYQQNA